MKKILPLVLALVCTLSLYSGEWQADILGDGYEMRHVEQPDDYSGHVRSTIVRRLSPCADGRAMLYVHGYNDYFFQKEMADRMVDSCISFYAVDLRKYGRSIMPGQKKFQARDIHEYFADIDSALSQMRSDGANRIVIMGHSTGGLTTSLYVKEKPQNDIKGLILNSPFLEWNFNGFMRGFAIPAVGSIGRIIPGLSLSQGSDSSYSESLLKSHHGEWDYNTDWKLFSPQKVEASWLRAISKAQKDLRKKPAITTPILLLHSSGSISEGQWTPEYQTNDAVLNVEDISRLGRQLGTDVTEKVIEQGMHDLMLSSPNVRENAYQAIFDWLQCRKIFQ